jgi:hypothetical protein
MFDRRWVILRFRAVFPYITVTYLDSTRQRGEARLRLPPGGESEATYFALLNALDLAKKVRALGGPQSQPIPVFFGLANLWLDQDRDGLIQHPQLPIQLPGFTPLFLSPANPVHRPPLRLPFRILAVGEAASALTDFRRARWHEDIREPFGLRIYECSPDDFTRMLRNAGADIIICHRDFGVHPLVSEVRESRKPRLLVVLDPLPVPTPESEVRLPAGMAELQIRTQPAGFLNDFLHEIVHDRPLHQAQQTARATWTNAPGATRLTATPFTNQSLRLTDTLVDLQHEHDRIAPAIRWLQHVSPDTRSIHLSNALTYNFNFARESRGLLPMAKMKLNLLEASRLVRAEAPSSRAEEFQGPEAAIPGPLPGPAAPVQPTIPVETAPEDQRIVNVVLRRLETGPLLSTLPPGYALLPHRQYELLVSIGEHLPESLVTGAQPALAPLLPPAEDASGHQLEVAIHGKDFRIHSQRIQLLQLPLIGPSVPVYFRISSKENSGRVSLRICLYFRNQLVQSYLLSATIQGEGRTDEMSLLRSEEGSTVHLEYARSKDQPWELEGLQPRALSLGVNQGAKTHEVIIKGDQTSGELTLLPSTFQPEVDALRTQLNGLASDPNGYERSYAKVPVGQQPALDVADAFRNLILRGRHLYLAFFGTASKNSSVRKAIGKVASSSDEKIQVVRFDDHFVFPWPLLYDFPIPDEREGDPPLPVCLGHVIDPCGASAPCRHTNRTEVYCVRGFWGVRHKIEEMLVQGNGKATSVSRPSKGRVRLVADLSLPEAAALETALKSIESTTEVGPPGGAKLLDLLWADPSERPSILVLLAHLENRDLPNEPKGVRVDLGGQSWLTLNELSNRIASDLQGWSDPRPIIMQMTCNSANVDVTTVNHFLLQWNTAGAAAIVGTEAVVGPKIASECARGLTDDLWSKKPLGDAVTDFRRELVFAGNPLGFLFSAYGDVDLAI